jgi:hypothetical protein
MAQINSKEQFQKDMELVQESLRRAFNPTKYVRFLDTWLNFELLFIVYPLILGISILIYKILK